MTTQGAAWTQEPVEARVRSFVGRLRWVLPLCLLAVGAAAPAQSFADPTPTCFGKHATIVGSGVIIGTPGEDVIVGSDGDRVLRPRRQ